MTTEAVYRKEIGQQLAITKAGEDWKSEALAALRAYIAIRKASGGTDFTFENFRVWAEQNGAIFPPASVNAWGSLPRSAVKAGICLPTGRVCKAHRPSSHSRLIRIWEAA